MSGADAPPPYSRVDPKSTGHDPGPSHRLQARNGITPEQRRSMEDLSRPLPTGWIRQFDHENNHQFYVDTKANPPRSIWHHPYDDDQYLSTLPSGERERLQELTRHSSIHDIVAEDSEDDSHHVDAKGHAPITAAGATGGAAAASGSAASSSRHDPPLPARDEKAGKRSWGRKMKDKVTNTTHEQREQQRRQREEEERKAYEQHLVFRRAMQKAMETGQPQKVGTDKNGKDVFVEPPMGPAGYGYSANSYGVNPYGSGGYYSNSMYSRPMQPYARPYGYGYGGGYGLPIAAGLGGGLLLGGMMGGMGGFGL